MCIYSLLLLFAPISTLISDSYLSSVLQVTPWDRDAYPSKSADCFCGLDIWIDHVKVSLVRPWWEKRQEFMRQRGDLLVNWLEACPGSVEVVKITLEVDQETERGRSARLLELP